MRGSERTLPEQHDGERPLEARGDVGVRGSVYGPTFAYARASVASGSAHVLRCGVRGRTGTAAARGANHAAPSATTTAARRRVIYRSLPPAPVPIRPAPLYEA